MRLLIGAVMAIFMFGVIMTLIAIATHILPLILIGGVALIAYRHRRRRPRNLTYRRAQEFSQHPIVKLGRDQYAEIRREWTK